MADEQTPEATLSLYPHFPMSDNGIRQLHQELGAWIHRAIERQINIDALSEQYAELASVSATFAEQHAPGMCQPVSAETPETEPERSEPTPITQAGGVGCPECERMGAG